MSDELPTHPKAVVVITELVPGAGWTARYTDLSWVMARGNSPEEAADNLRHINGELQFAAARRAEGSYVDMTRGSYHPTPTATCPDADDAPVVLTDTPCVCSKGQKYYPLRRSELPTDTTTRG